jgi:glycosyltransferase involved in cell wall biosynthesis
MRDISIDVILPFHRSDLFLKRALDSVNQAVGVQINLILIDDRPEFEETNFDITLRTGGIGYAAAINAALPHMQSEFCALMNSDDLVHPRRFINQVTALQKSGKKISVTRMRKFQGPGFPIFMLGGNPRFDKFYREAQLITSFYANASWLMDTDYWTSIGKIDDFGNGSDWAWGVKLFDKTEPFVHPEVLYFYRSHQNQSTRSENALDPRLAMIWGELNLSLCLPDLSPFLGINLALPGAKVTIKLELDQISSWTKEFSLRFPELEKLLALRIVALFYYAGEFNQLRRFPFVFKYLPKLSSMYAFNKITGT